jgi:hypothetical protein
MRPKLDALAFPSAFTTIDVTYHTPPASPSPNPSDGITGTWDGLWQNDQQWGGAAGGFTMVVVQKGKAFSGTIDVTGPTCVRSGTVAGTVENGRISMGWVAAGIRDVAFEGTLTGSTMAGTWTMTACGVEQSISGTWSAARQ